MLKKENLNIAFNTAIKENAKFVFVGIDVEGTEEIISIPNKSFLAKIDFYNNAYSDDLTHVMNKNVKIFGITHGDESNLSDLLE